jgi:hypothetical protein
MSKKMLSEAQIRRFAKLASLAPINEMYGGNKGDEPKHRDYMNEEDAIEDVEAEVDSALPPGEEVEMSPGEDEITDEPEMTADPESEALAGDVLSAVASALESALGVDIEIDGGEEELDVPEEMGAIEDAEMDFGDEEVAIEDEEEMMAEALRGINYIPGKKDIINEVAKRVAKRLLAATKAEKNLKEALGKKPRRQRSPRRTK